MSLTAMSETSTTTAPLAGEAALIARYDGRAPRYTSYPTAAQFTPAVDAQTYAGWLADLDPGEAISLYVHIPFCRRLCWYCGCNTRAVNRPETIRDYVGFLRQELALLEQALPGLMRVSTLHLGGGTPNMLTREDMSDLFGGLRHVFKLGGEIAAELDHAALTESWVKAAAIHGLTRASLGVQDLNPDVQKAIGRIEPLEVVERAVGWLREAGIPSINFDLMYGLPSQTADGLIATLDKLLPLRPERVALFGYAHVPWMKPHQGLIDVSALPGAAERLAQARAAAGRLIAAGYVAIGSDPFALPQDELALAAATGNLHRNFQGYTPDKARALIGLGASSISHLPQGYAQNDASETGWRKAVAEERLPIVRGVAFAGQDKVLGDIIERLMCDLRADLPAICARHGQSMADIAGQRKRLDDFVADGLVTEEAGVITITQLGRPFVRSVCAVFDGYLDPAAIRHAQVL